MFHVPAGFHELRGQPVEQFRMRGLVAVATEIVHAGHQWRMEMPGPDMIDRHASCQRVITACDPHRQGATTAGALLWIRWRQWRVCFRQLLIRQSFGGLLPVRQRGRQPRHCCLNEFRAFSIVRRLCFGSRNSELGSQNIRFRFTQSRFTLQTARRPDPSGKIITWRFRMLRSIRGNAGFESHQICASDGEFGFGGLQLQQRPPRGSPSGLTLYRKCVQLGISNRCRHQRCRRSDAKRRRFPTIDPGDILSIGVLWSFEVHINQFCP